MTILRSIFFVLSGPMLLLKTMVDVILADGEENIGNLQTTKAQTTQRICAV